MHLADHLVQLRVDALAARQVVAVVARYGWLMRNILHWEHFSGLMRLGPLVHGWGLVPHLEALVHLRLIESGPALLLLHWLLRSCELPRPAQLVILYESEHGVLL